MRTIKTCSKLSILHQFHIKGEGVRELYTPFKLSVNRKMVLEWMNSCMAGSNVKHQLIIGSPWHRPNIVYMDNKTVYLRQPISSICMLTL
jgi:hypothetical protein